MKSITVTIQIKATEHYFPVFDFLSLWMKFLSVITEMKATVVLLSNVVLKYKKCDNWNQSYWLGHCCSTV